MTTAPRPSRAPHLRRKSRSRRGMRKARVLPDPVEAEPRMSRWRREGGIERDWMWVGVRKWQLFKPVLRLA